MLALSILVSAAMRFVAQRPRQALAGQQRAVDRPVLGVARLPLDARELVVRQPADLVLDRSRRLVEQDARRRLLRRRCLRRRDDAPQATAAPAQLARRGQLTAAPM